MTGKVAVVIPAWNLRDELNQAILSVTEQNVGTHVLIVDNASDEPLSVPTSADVVRLPQRVTVGAARNAGLDAVDEEFVMFMEGDDLLLPGALEFLYRKMATRPEATVIAGSVLLWNPRSGNRVPARWPFDYCYRLNRFPRLFSAVNCVRNVLPTTGPVLIRASAARAAGGFADVNWAEDWAFGAVLGFTGVPILSRRVCGLYRVDPDRVTLSDAKEARFRPAWRGRMEVRRKLRTSPVVPRCIRASSPLLMLPHTYFTLLELRMRRQRVD